MTANARPRDERLVPPYTFFTDSVLRVLGRRTQLQPRKVVTLDDSLRVEVLTDAGFDPANLPKAWPTNPKSKTPAGIDTTINCAYRFLHHKTHRGRHGSAQAISLGRGKWGLTELGVTEAQRLLNPAPNTTSQWLTKHLTPEPGMAESKLMGMMKGAVAKKCPVSASLDQVEDHVQTCLLRLIHRDALRTRLGDGRGVTYSHLATYAVRSAYTDMRDAGTEPLLRERFGARTEKERQQRKAEIAASGHIPPSQVHIRSQPRTSVVDFDGKRQLADVPDMSASVCEVLSDRMSFERLWARVSATMKSAKPKASDRYVGILQMQIDGGFSVREIAEAAGVSPHRAATMLQVARRAVRDAGRDSLMM